MRWICHIELRRKRGSGLDFKEQEGKFTGSDKEQTCDEFLQGLLGHPETRGHRGRPNETDLLGSFLPNTLSSH